MNKFDPFITQPTPSAERPLLGVTVLVVEDSRYACEAMRLMCLKSGARIRRAGTLEQARRHLRTYRPGVVIVDMGLPDGSGAELIADLAHGSPRVEVILGSSGDADAEAAARVAGADGFLPKPMASVAAFQAEILRHLPEGAAPSGPRAINTDDISPDPMALRDDLSHAADLLSSSVQDFELDYLTQFVNSIAIQTQDPALTDANNALARRRASGAPLRPGVARLSQAIQDRMESLPRPI